jgi:hypothetical protein
MTGVVADKPFNTYSWAHNPELEASAPLFLPPFITTTACISRDFLQESLQVEAKQRDARNLREEGHIEI